MSISSLQRALNLERLAVNPNLRIDVHTGEEVPFPHEFLIGKTGAVGNTGRGLFTYKGQARLNVNSPRRNRVLETIGLQFGVYTIERRVERTGTWYVVRNGDADVSFELTQFAAHHAVRVHHGAIANKSRLVREALAIKANAGETAPGTPVTE